ncbi:pentatricopeptide repeat-containing protein At2g13600-like [Selaginella moellendorffii]|uniref:pentatricopeptide repeat-containing protein At2g13600-like n=1 Tax=Selaginella moellendorffii TaxID=88036 RepID=UPI000D1C37C6|nr:pentatricopeptide repeat-containing protein At2g13600-like [Selaginella moellendorffii]|eukprot:XP_024542608.1 pentatricopeptide repeat-containing protein At2g13600-like [Selaginella moellendorffii]
MVDTLARCGKLEEAKEIFDQVRGWCISSWTSMIFAYTSFGYFEEAEALFYTMPEVDTIARNAFISSLALNLKLASAVRVFHRANQRDITTWNTVLSAFARDGHLQEAEKVFRSMPERDLVSWNSVLEAYAGQGKPAQAIGFFYELQQQWIPSAISVVCFLVMTRDFGLEATKQHYSCVIDLLCRAVVLANAQAVIAEMPSVPDLVDWHCVLAFCSSDKNLEQGRVCAMSVLEMEPNNAAAYVSLSQTLI